MPTYTDVEKKLIDAARANTDADAGNEALVRIAAAKAGIPNTDIVYLEPEKDARFVEKTDAGIYYLVNSSGEKAGLTKRRICPEAARDGTCTRAFNHLPVKNTLCGYFVGEHDHLPPINYALVNSFRLLLALRDDGDDEELADFHRCHNMIQAKMSKPAECDEKYLNYVVLQPGIDEAAYRAMTTKERFECVVYAGLSKTSIAKRMMNHSKPTENLFAFTSNGAIPTFLVVHTEQVLSAGEAAHKETRMIALAGSDHHIHNTDQGAKWRRLAGVTDDEEHRGVSVSMANLLDEGYIYKCDWSVNVKRNESKRPDPMPDDESPTVGRKRRKRASNTTPSLPPTPVSALEQFHFSPSPGSATVRTSDGSNFFNYDGTLEDLRAKRAGLDKALNEEEEKLQRQEEGRDDGP